MIVREPTDHDSDRIDRATRERFIRFAAVAIAVLTLLCHANGTLAQTTKPASAPSANAPSGVGGLLAHATNETYWIARITRERRNDPTSPERTIIYARTILETQWKQVTTLRGRVVSLTDNRGDLVALMADGQWLSIWADGTSLGTPPPAGVQLRSVARGPEGLVALATQAATSSTQPASTGLYRFENGAWKNRSELPIPPDALSNGDVRTAAGPTDIFFLVPGKRPVDPVVYRVRANGDVETINLQLNSSGVDLPKSANLFVAGSRVMLGVVSRLGDVRLTALTDPSFAPINLSAPSVAAIENAMVTFAAENYRLLLVSGDAISEQTYRPDGTPAGKLTKLSFGPQGEPVSHWNQFIVMFGIAIMLFAISSRRGGVIQLPVQLGIRLAPIIPRLAAGAVDALPILVTAAILSYQFDFNGAMNSETQALTGQQAWWMTLATAAYLLHTSISELLTGRTVGKWIFKLWVVSIDAQPARPGQIVTRNLLRVLDVSMAGFPLLLMFASPLRQRVGDLAAGTMVVAKGVADPAEEADPALARSVDLESDDKRKL